MRYSNTNGVIIFLLSPAIVYGSLFIGHIIFYPFTLLQNFFEIEVGNGSIGASAFEVFMVIWFSIFCILVTWQITKRLEKPSLSNVMLFVLIGVFTLKGFFEEVPRPLFYLWFSLWIYAPFLLMACAAGMGLDYLKRYLWFPIAMDVITLFVSYWRQMAHAEDIEKVTTQMTVANIGSYFLWLLLYVLLFIGFAVYTARAHNPNKTRWKIPTIWLGIPAFTVGLLFTALFFIMF